MKKPKKPNGFIENPNKPNGLSEKPTKPKKLDIDKEIDIEKDIEIDSDEDTDIEKEEIASDFENKENEKPNGFFENPNKPNGFSENPAEPKKPDIDKEIDVEKDIEIDSDKDIEIDNDIDKDIDSESEKEKEKIEEKMNDEEKMKSKNKKTDFDYICEKLDEILGPTSDKIKNECCDYLRFLSLEVILYAIVITERARTPCWNYTKRVLEDYKSKKIRTFNQLLVYLDKTEKSKNNNYTNRTHYSFMDDMHSEEEWEALYDN